MAHSQADVAEVTLARTLDFKCTSCGFADSARLTVTASGAATRGATSADSRDVANERAQHGADVAFERASLIIRCPRCQSFDPGKLRAYREDRGAALAIIGGLSLVGLVIGLAAPDLQRLGFFIAGGFALSGLQPLAQIFRPPRVDVTFGSPRPESRLSATGTAVVP